MVLSEKSINAMVILATCTNQPCNYEYINGKITCTNGHPETLDFVNQPTIHSIHVNEQNVPGNYQRLSEEFDDMYKLVRTENYSPISVMIFRDPDTDDNLYAVYDPDICEIFTFSDKLYEMLNTKYCKRGQVYARKLAKILAHQMQFIIEVLGNYNKQYSVIDDTIVRVDGAPISSDDLGQLFHVREISNKFVYKVYATYEQLAEVVPAAIHDYDVTCTVTDNDEYTIWSNHQYTVMYFKNDEMLLCSEKIYKNIWQGLLLLKYGVKAKQVAEILSREPEVVSEILCQLVDPDTLDKLGRAKYYAGSAWANHEVDVACENAVVESTKEVS